MRTDTGEPKLKFNHILPAGEVFGELAVLPQYDELTIGSAADYERQLRNATDFYSRVAVLVECEAGRGVPTTPVEHTQDTTLFD